MRSERGERSVPEALFSALLLALGLWAFALAAPWPIKAALYPRAMAGAVVVACAACCALALSDRGEKPGSRVDLSFERDLPPEVVRRRTLEACAWVGGFLVAGWLVGLLPAMVVLVLAYLRWAGGERWTFSLGAAAVTWVALEGFMVRLLHLPIPTGVFGVWLGR